MASCKKIKEMKCNFHDWEKQKHELGDANDR